MVLTMSRVRRHESPDPKRVLAITGVLLIHLAVLAVMLLPRQAATPWKPAPPPELVIDWGVEPEPPPKPPEVVLLPPPPIPLAPLAPPEAAPTPSPLPSAPTVSNDVVVDAPGEPVVPTAIVDPQAGAAVPGTPGNLLTLKPLRSPPPAYPRRELARGIEGAVELRVLVDAAGQPTTIEVIGGSGHRSFELAATRALKRWRFEPHRVNGVPQAAWARVPFSFRIE